jgi:hypothetical protein
MKDAPRDTGAFTPRDETMSGIKSERLRLLPQVTVAKVTGIGIPPRIDLVHFEKKYNELGNKSLSLLKSTKNGEREYVVVGPPLKPDELLAILDYVSPDKSIPANTGEIVDHWDELEIQTPLYDAHESDIPGWTDFAKSGTAAIEYLRTKGVGKANTVRHHDPHDFIVPVFRWKTDRDGNRTIILTPFTAEEKQDIVDTIEDDSLLPSQLNESVGLAYLAAYSPVITKEWPSWNTYHPKNENIPAIHKQEIDFIQALPYPYRMVAARQENPLYVPDRQDLQGSSLLSDFERYAETGDLPTYDPLQAIRRNVLDFFVGYDLTQMNVTTKNSAEIATRSQGNPHIHRAKSADGLRVTLSQNQQSTDRRSFTDYELMKEGKRLQITLRLTDYSDGTSEVTATTFNPSKFIMQNVDLTSAQGQELIQEYFDITLS